MSPDGQTRYEFNAQGMLTGVGVQVTGPNNYNSGGVAIPANTFAGVQLTPNGGISVGFSNSIFVQTGSVAGVPYGANISTGVFSAGRFTSVNGSVGVLGVPVPFTNGLLLSKLNASSAIANIATTTQNLANLASKVVSCSDIF